MVLVHLLVKPTMARKWRDLLGAAIALLLWKSHYLAQLSLSKRIHRLTQIRWRLMSVNTRHAYRRVTEQVSDIPKPNSDHLAFVVQLPDCS